MKKVGRNDPCTCGSGKKYKNCCMHTGMSLPDVNVPEEFLTGTPLDGYMELQPLMAMWLQREKQFSDDRTELSKMINVYEDKFRPGESDGITDTIFMMWQFYELRYGRSGKTLYERIADDPLMQELHADGRAILASMNASYNAWYRLQRILPDWLVFVELGTEREWHVARVCEPAGPAPQADDIWFIRFVGSPEAAYIFGDPFMYPATAEPGIRLLIERSQKIFSGQSGMDADAPDFFVQYCKEMVQFWSAFITGDAEVHRELAQVLDDNAGTAVPPVMNNTDGDPLEPSTISFKMHDIPAVTKVLKRLRSMDYDEEQGVWQWSKKNRKKGVMGERILLATIRLDGDMLIAETNSERRAKLLCGRLLESCGMALSYRRLEILSMDQALEDLPENGDEDSASMQGDPNDDPAVRAEITGYMNRYYLENWIYSKVPMLGNRKPVDIAETEEGRDVLRRMLNDFERADRRLPEDMKNPVDWDAVRNKLGI